MGTTKRDPVHDHTVPHMSTDDPHERDTPESHSDATNSHPPVSRPRVGMRPLTGLLGSLLDISVRTPRLQSRTRVGTSPAGHRVDRHLRRRGPNRARRTREQTHEPGDALVETRFEGDTFVVNADLPGATTEDLSVGINARTNALVIARSGTVCERVALPWRSPEATRVWLNNGVLEVRLRPRET